MEQRVHGVRRQERDEPGVMGRSPLSRISMCGSRPVVWPTGTEFVSPFSPTYRDESGVMCLKHLFGLNLSSECGRGGRAWW